MPVRVFYDPHRVAQLRQQGIDPPKRQLRGNLAGDAVPEARTDLGPVEERARLRAENERLRRDNQRLSAEVARLSEKLARRPNMRHAAESDPEPNDDDDAAQRLGFSLLEMDP